MPGTPSGVGQIIDHTSTPEEFERFLNGRDIEDYGTAGDLFEEVKSHHGGVFLRNNVETGRINRYSWSSRLCIFDLEEGILWEEIARAQLDGRVVPKDRGTSLTETLQKGETFVDALIRSVWEEMAKPFHELGYEPKKHHMWPQEPDFELKFPGVDLGLQYDGIDRHPSSVWKNVDSIVTYRHYDLALDFHHGTARRSPYLGKHIIVNKDFGGRPTESSRHVTCFLQAKKVPIPARLMPRLLQIMNEK